MKQPNKFDRRQILKGAGMLGGLVMARAATAQQPDAAPKVQLEPQCLSTAERIAGMSYTPSERAMIFDELEGMIDRVRKRRAAVTFKNSDPPALTFDPRLPGKTYAPQENHVQLAAEAPGLLPDDESIAFAPIHAQAHWIKTGQISAGRLTDIYLTRIARYAPALSCFVTVTEALAREQAAKADGDLRDGKYHGPLHGIPYALKDLFDAKGLPATWGAEPYRTRVAEDDAVITRRLRKAGAVLLGKATLGALAYGDRWFGGITKNPWNPLEGASGSSAGSAAATAAGLCSFAIGTETMGSIVSPTARCGVVGLKPSYGRVARTGAMALCWSLDKAGPICRSVEDTALVLAAINGADKGDAASFDHGFAYDGRVASAAEIRIGYDPAWFAGEDAHQLDSRVLEHLRGMGFVLKEVSLPKQPYPVLLSALEVEASAAFEELTLSNRDDLLSWQEPAAWPNTFRTAHFHSAVEYVQLDRFRRQVMDMVARVYEEVDVIVCPSFAGDMLIISNFTGYPSLTLPVGMTLRETHPLTGEPGSKLGKEKAVPHAITLWGNLFREDQLLGVGRLLEEIVRFTVNRPALTEHKQTT